MNFWDYTKEHIGNSFCTIIKCYAAFAAILFSTPYLLERLSNIDLQQVYLTLTAVATVGLLYIYCAFRTEAKHIMDARKSSPDWEEKFRDRKPLTPWDVEISSSYIFLDIIAVLFSSYKVGETMAKIHKDFSTRTGLQVPEDFSTTMGILLLSSLFLLYSFSKASDKLRCHKGVDRSTFASISLVENLHFSKKVAFAAAPWCVNVLVLIVAPVAYGFMIN